MNDRGWTDQDLSKPREEWANVEAIPSNQAPEYTNSEHWHNEHSNTPLGYGFQQTSDAHKSSEHYYSEGFTEKGGPNINGKTPSELINSGLLTVQNIKPDEKQVVFEDIMLGLTNNKNMLSQKIDLIISDKNIVNSIISNQYMLAIQEMKKEEKGFVDNTPTNRKFQFLSTVKILMEKGYDINSLSFKNGDAEIGLAKLISNFRKECAEHKAKNIEDPSWFKTGRAPQNYDARKVNDPWLFSGTLITEIYANNPQMFETEYKNYKSTTRRPPEQILSYEEFIHYAYGIKVPAEYNNLQHFKETREKQIQYDQIIRQQQLGELTKDMVEIKEGHNLK